MNILIEYLLSLIFFILGVGVFVGMIYIGVWVDERFPDLKIVGIIIAIIGVMTWAVHELVFGVW